MENLLEQLEGCEINANDIKQEILDILIKQEEIVEIRNISFSEISDSIIQKDKSECLKYKFEDKYGKLRYFTINDVISITQNDHNWIVIIYV